MANITPYTNQIREARYGRDVRSSIVNALEAMNSDINSDTASARTYANNAADSASDAESTAQGLVDTLAQIETDLNTFENAESIRDSAESNRVSAEAARAAAERARENAETGYVAQARQYAAQAQQYASSDNAILSQSWAVGGTSTRYGEDTNNAKYWCEQAAYIITEGGVATWNGRAGAVVPEAGDYTAAQITRGTGTVDSSLTSLESEYNTLTGTTIPGLESDIAEKVDKTTPLIELDTTAAASTVDGHVTTALTALSWLSSVFVDGMLNLKNLLIKILNRFIAQQVSLVSDTDHPYLDGNTVIRRQGGIVHIYVRGLKNIPSQTETVICNIPDGFRSPNTYFVEAYNQANANIPIRIQIQPNGTMSVYNYSNSTTGVVNVYANITYITSPAQANVTV